MNEVITIDGPSGSGKSTVSRILAKKISFHYLDTGAMYRAVALAAKRKGINLKDGQKLRELCKSLDLRFKTDGDPPRLFLGEEDISMAIRSPEMDMLSSGVSSIKEVREAMTDLQRKIAKGVNLVTEGRDMGTVVFPNAKYKFFLTASTEIRVERRYRERLERGEPVSKASVAAELVKRDRQDEMRSLAPLKPATDAKLIDSDALTAEEVVEEILGCLEAK
jgi:cytidylate kinase